MPPDSEVLNFVGVLVQVLVVEDVGVLLGQPRRHVPVDDADVAGRAQVLRAAVTGLGEELLLQVGVTPVLEHDVDVTGAEALPGDVLLELLVVDLAAELLSATWPDDVGVGLVADPRVDRDVEVAAVALACRPRSSWSPRRWSRRCHTRRARATAAATPATSRPAFLPVLLISSPASLSVTCHPRAGLLVTSWATTAAYRPPPLALVDGHGLLLRPWRSAAALAMRSTMMPSSTIVMPAAAPLPHSSLREKPSTVS